MGVSFQVIFDITLMPPGNATELKFKHKYSCDPRRTIGFVWKSSKSKIEMGLFALEVRLLENILIALTVPAEFPNTVGLAEYLYTTAIN